MPRSEAVEFRAGDLTLAGELTLPDAAPASREGPPRHPSVLLLPSYLPRDRDGRLDFSGHPGWFSAGSAGVGLLRRLAPALAAHGVASLRYDKRGCGASEGVWEEADLFSLVDDARDAVAYLRSRSELDIARLGMVAHGEGAAIAMSVAIGDPAIGNLTLVGAPARGFRDVLRRQVTSRAEREGQAHRFVWALDRWAEDIVERADRGEEAFLMPLPGRPAVRLRLAGWHQAFNTPPIALATMLHRSVTVVHGTGDQWVAPDESGLLAEALRQAGNEPVLRLVAGAGHDLAEADDAEIAALAEDVAARLPPRPLPPVLLAIQGMQ